MQIASQYIAPWAIAKEPFPLHLIWDPEEKFDFVEIELPKECEVRELLNVREYQDTRSKIRFSNMSLFSPNYFSLVAASKTTFDELIKKIPITISFLLDDKKIFSRTFYAQIVRPRIDIEESPLEIAINDNTNAKKLLNFTVKHTGLGKAKIDFTANVKGNIISESDSLYFQVFREVAEDLEKGELDKDDTVEEEMKAQYDFSLDPIAMQKHVTNILDLIKSKKAMGNVRKEVFEKLLEFIDDEESREALVRAIYTKLQRIFISYLLYYFDKSPHDDVEMLGGKMKLNMNYGIKSINFKISYTDSQENSYEPIETTVNVSDARTKKDKFEIPINIKWISKPLKMEKGVIS